MIQTERKTRYHKSVRRVDNYMLSSKEEMNIREVDHKNSGTQSGSVQLQLLPPSVITPS